MAPLGLACGPLGTLLGPSWDPLGPLLAALWRSWGALGVLLGALGRSWGALGALLGTLGALLGKNTKISRREYKFRGVLGRGFGRVLAILNVLVKNLRLYRPSHRFFYFFCIVRELLVKARTLIFVAPVEVLWGFSEVDVLRSRRFGTRDDLRKTHHFTLRLEAKFLQNRIV